MRLGISSRWRSVPRRRFVESAVQCAVLWFLLYVPQLLPSYLADQRGVWIALLVGFLLPLFRADRVIRPLTFGITLCLAIVATMPVSDKLATWWIREDQMPAEGVGAVIPLSGSVNNQGMMNAEALDHLITALEIVKRGKAPVLATTIVEGTSPAGYFTSEADQARMLALFAAPVEWVHTPIVHTTREEAVESAALLQPRGIRRIALVVSPMHTRRGCAAFEAVGFQVTCVVSRTGVPGGRRPEDWPRDRLSAFGDWVYEALATVEYRQRGWLDAPRSATGR